MSFSSILPTPKQHYGNGHDDHPLFQQRQQQQPAEDKKVIHKVIPPYGQRKGYQPKNVEDFGDGGAFPEIHCAQFPLNMGRKNKQGKSAATTGNTGKDIIPVQVDADGRAKYESVLGIDTKSKILYSQYKDLIPKQFGESELERPSEELVQDTTNRTKQALEKIVQGKISAAQPKGYTEPQAQVSYVKYTPQGGGQNGDPQTRVIRMVEAAKDPMEPPKFKIKKEAKRSRSPPPTIMHSPERKATAAELEEWNIPPCVSNYSNKNGFTISLDKRLAADGRNLQRPEVNEKFAHFTQALYIAETNSRDEVTARAELEIKMAQKEKERKQEMLRKLAEDVRNERSGITAKPSGRSYQDEDRDTSTSSDDEDLPPVKKENGYNKRDDDGKRDHDRYTPVKNERERDGRRDRDYDDDRRRDTRDNIDSRDYDDDRRRDNRDRDGRRDNRDNRDYDEDRRRDRDRDIRRDRDDERHRPNNVKRSRDDSGHEDDDDARELRDRERVRAELKREREREYRLEASGRKSKMNRDQERDISEKIALGQAQHVRGEDSIYDQRLFNQSEGMSSGFNGGDDESYNIYSKPLFADKLSNSIYRPRGGATQDGEESVDELLKSSRFKPNKEFSGVDKSRERSGPVLFEQERNKQSNNSNNNNNNNKSKSSDPFGMDEFLSQAKRGKDSDHDRHRDGDRRR